MIARGRALAFLLRAEPAAADLLALLRATEATLDGLPWDATASPEDPLIAEDGWRLVRAAVCGAGSPLDGGRERGHDYTYAGAPRSPADGLPTRLVTVSWDPEVVIYRFTGLNAKAEYRLRALCGVDAERSLALAVDGQQIREFVVPGGTVTECAEALPQEITGDGEIEIQVRRIAGANAILSGLELWSTEPQCNRRSGSACSRAARSRPWRRRPHPMRLLTLPPSPVGGAASSSLIPPSSSTACCSWSASGPAAITSAPHRVGEHQTPGANLCILRGSLPTARSPGCCRRRWQSRWRAPDLSYDGTRIVFPYAAPRETPTPYPWAAGHTLRPSTPPTAAGTEAARVMRPYEIGVDALGPEATDPQPRFRGHGAPATCPMGGSPHVIARRPPRAVWRLGARLRPLGDAAMARPVPITEPQDTEFFPSVMNDGRSSTRWDYVMKAYNVIQQLWSVRGRNRCAPAYGDWYAFKRSHHHAGGAPDTGVIQAGRRCAAHHNTGVGPLVLADLNLLRWPPGMTNLTPEVGYPECEACSTSEPAGRQ